MTDIELLEEINTNIKKLLGVIATQGMSDEKKIITLQSMDYNSTDIHKMTGIPLSTVKRKWVKNKKKGKN